MDKFSCNNFVAWFGLMRRTIELFVCTFLIMMSAISFSASWSHAETFQLCEDLSRNIGEYSTGEEVYESLTEKAKLMAVDKFINEELYKLSPTFDRKELLNNLMPFLRYDSVTKGSGGVFRPCVTLENAHFHAEVINNFKPVTISRFCSDDKKLLNRFAFEAKKSFIAILRDQKDTKNIPSQIKSLFNKKYRLIKVDSGIFEKLIHEKNDVDVFNGLEGVNCKELFVYPIEIFSMLSSQKNDGKNTEVSGIK